MAETSTRHNYAILQNLRILHIFLIELPLLVNYEMLNKFSVVGYFFQKINFLSQFFLKLQGNDVFFHCKDVRSDFKWEMNINNEVMKWMKSHKRYFLITEPKIRNGINLFPCNMLAAAVTLLILTFRFTLSRKCCRFVFQNPKCKHKVFISKVLQDVSFKNVT